MFQGGGQLIRWHARVLLQPQHQARVDRPGTGGHHQAFQRREPHGGVHRHAAAHGGERRAGAQVAGDDPASPPPVRLPGATHRRGTGRGSRTAAAPTAGATRVAARRWPRRRGSWRGTPCRSTPPRHVGQRPLDRCHRRQRLRLVQRGEVGQRAQPAPARRRRSDRRRERGATVYDPVADGVNVTERGELGAHGSGVRLAARCRQVGAAGHLVRSVEDPQLEAAGAGVDHENPDKRV